MAEDTGAALLAAAGAGDASQVHALLHQGADPGHQGQGGQTPLMAAAAAGDAESVAALLSAGAPWHELDEDGCCAGEYASGSGHVEVVRQLLDWAVRAELVLGAASRRASAAPAPGPQGYLQERATYRDGQLVDAEGEAVMMTWEAPLMREHARILCAAKGRAARVLNVGFGLGIIDGYIAELAPARHTIVEAHPDVLAHMAARGWTRRPGVSVVPGRWQDVIADLGPFDGVFFDTYGEYAEDMREFHAHLPRLLSPGGVYSFFNGLCPDNIFFNMVQGEVVKLELARLGLETQYRAMPMDTSDGSIWKGIRNRYWHLPVYMVPTCTLKA
ncbi:GUM1 [Auxenochlorella protothecoides x Auxenochlorella symbiontica]